MELVYVFPTARDPVTLCHVAATIAASAATAAVTNAVVEICVVFVPGAAVGAVGVPVRAGEAFGASNASAAVARVVSVATAVVTSVTNASVPGAAGSVNVKLPN